MTDDLRSGSSLKATLGFGIMLAGLGLGAALISPFSALRVWISIGLFSALVTASWFDFDHYRIPNWISLPLIAIGLVMPTILPGASFDLHLAGAVAGYALVWALQAYWLKFRGQEGIGMGDAKLLAASGAWLGVLALPIITLVASGSALLWIGGRAILAGQSIDPKQRLPFGPFIALGFWTVWLMPSV